MHRKGCCSITRIALFALLALCGFLKLKWYFLETSLMSKSMTPRKNVPLAVKNKTHTIFVEITSSRPPTLTPTKEARIEADVPCQPRNRIVFIKTHKTGSSTVTTMLERYGYQRDLNFALPTGRHFFSIVNKFDASEVYRRNQKDAHGATVWPALGGFHILANHARYNHEEMAKLIPNATYFTIIRHPVTQFESAFVYFGMDQEMPKANGSGSPLETFFGDPERYFDISNVSRKVFARNGQLYELGLDTHAPKSQDLEIVGQKISLLSREMDLVMITEYFDESLILLKKLLCWQFDDILYISKGVRKSTVRTNITAELREKIQEWNQADVKLYQHFNQTLWEKIRRYGPSFQRDLETFRRLKMATTERCLVNSTLLWDTHRSSVFKLPQTASEDCQDLVRYDMNWVSILRRRMAEKSSEFSKRTGLATLT